MSKTLPTLVLACLVAGCASAGGRLGRVSDELIVFPTPPDTARVQFLFTVSSEHDVRPDPGWLASFLDENPEGAMMVKPYGVAYGNERFYVCDSMLPGVDIVDMAEGSFLHWQPRGYGELRKPINCEIDPSDGSLYVTDTERRQVVVFDSTGAYAGAIGDGSGNPVDVVVAEDRIWVADLANRRVEAYDRATLEMVAAFPGPDADSAAVLRQPTNLAVAGGRVYVSDFGAFNVKMFRTDGTFERTIGSYGRGHGQFARPKGVAVDRDGRIYVVDAGFQNVQVFDEDGGLLLFFGGPYQGPGSMWLPAKVRVTYEDLDRFAEYVDPTFELEYVILVTNQYGPDRLNVYGFVRPRGAMSAAR